MTFCFPPFSRSQRQFEQQPDAEFADTEEHHQFAIERFQRRSQQHDGRRAQQPAAPAANAAAPQRSRSTRFDERPQLESRTSSDPDAAAPADPRQPIDFASVGSAGRPPEFPPAAASAPLPPPRLSAVDVPPPHARRQHPHGTRLPDSCPPRCRILQRLRPLVPSDQSGRVVGRPDRPDRIHLRRRNGIRFHHLQSSITFVH